MPVKIRNLHSWDVDYKAAVAIQAELREKLILADGLSGDIRIVAGADISCTKGDDRVYAAVVLLDAATLEVIEEATYSGRISIPYIPGLLSFREGPALLRPLGSCGDGPIWFSSTARVLPIPEDSAWQPTWASSSIFPPWDAPRRG